MLKASKADREARQKKLEEDARIASEKLKYEKRQAAQDAKIKIQKDMARRQIEYEKQAEERKELMAAAENQSSRQPQLKIGQNSITPKPRGDQKSSSRPTLGKNRVVGTKKERQEVLAFYLRPDVTYVIGEYEVHLASLYDRIVGAHHPSERDLKRMSLNGFYQGFAATTGLVPQALTEKDFDLLFETIIDERVDQGTSLENDAIANKGQSLSFEEFKKSLIRISTIVMVKATQ